MILQGRMFNLWLMNKTLKDSRVVLRAYPLLRTRRRRGHPTHSNQAIIPPLGAILIPYKKFLIYQAAIMEKKHMQKSQPSLLKSKSKTHLCSFKSGCLSAMPKMTEMKTTRKILQLLQPRYSLCATPQHGSTHMNACFKIAEGPSGTQSSSSRQAATTVLWNKSSS